MLRNDEIDFDNLERLFLYCEARLPHEEYFLEFCDQYCGLSLIISMLTEVPDCFKENWSSVKEMIIETWITFTSGIRVKQKDDYYKENESEWDFEFKNKLSKLNKKIKELDLKILNDEIDFPKVELSRPEKKILKKIFEDYMMGDYNE